MRTLAEIIQNIKELKKLSNEAEVAILLGIKPKTLYTAKSRNSIPYEELALYCMKEGISLDLLLTGTVPAESAALYKGIEFIFVPQVTGEISAGGGLIADNTVEMTVAFRKNWIEKKGVPHKMAVTKVRGDSMEPTLFPGDIVLIDHSKNFVDPHGGIYAIAFGNEIMVKRIQVLYPSNRLRIISDNPRYEPAEIEPDQVIINGKVIWFGREIDR